MFSGFREHTSHKKTPVGTASSTCRPHRMCWPALHVSHISMSPFVACLSSVPLQILQATLSTASIVLRRGGCSSIVNPDEGRALLLVGVESSVESDETKSIAWFILIGLALISVPNVCRGTRLASAACRPGGLCSIVATEEGSIAILRPYVGPLGIRDPDLGQGLKKSHNVLLFTCWALVGFLAMPPALGPSVVVASLFWVVTALTAIVGTGHTAGVQCG